MCCASRINFENFYKNYYKLKIKKKTERMLSRWFFIDFCLIFFVFACGWNDFYYFCKQAMSKFTQIIFFWFFGDVQSPCEKEAFCSWHSSWWSKISFVLIVVTWLLQSPTREAIDAQASAVSRLVSPPRGRIALTCYPNFSSGIENNPTVFYRLMPGSTAQTNKFHTFYLQQRPENGFTWADIKVNHPLDFESIKEYNLTIRVEV